MCNLWKIKYFKIFLTLGCLILFINSARSQQKSGINIIENIKPVGLPVYTFPETPLLSLTEHNYHLAAFSSDMKMAAVARSYSRTNSFVSDIVLIRMKNLKETVLLDTQTIIRYGRPHGFLYNIYFNEESQLVAKISDGMDGVSILTIDPEKKEIIKDEYLPEYSDEYDGEEEDQDEYYEQKINDLRRIFPKKNKILLSELTYKLVPVDTVGYISQGILANDNSIFYLPHGKGNLRLIHNFSNPQQNDNIDGVWGNSHKAFYLLKDKKNNYFFRYDIQANKVTLLEKYPPHSHFSYIYDYKLKNGATLLSFEVETKSTDPEEILKLFLFNRNQLFKVEGYPVLLDIKYIPEKHILLLYYMKNGKRCLDAHQLGD